MGQPLLFYVKYDIVEMKLTKLRGESRHEMDR
jgi:hypothetical protein